MDKYEEYLVRQVERAKLSCDYWDPEEVEVAVLVLHVYEDVLKRYRTFNKTRKPKKAK